MKRPAFRYYVTYAAATHEVFPFDTPKCKLVNKQEPDQIFFRKKLNGRLVFKNDSKLGITDFDFFKTIELNGNSCTPIGIDIQKFCEGNVADELLQELVTNGGFSGNALGWTLNHFTYNASGVLADNDDPNEYILQNIGAVAGNSYSVTYTVTGMTRGSHLALLGSTGFGTQRTTDGTFTETIVASGLGADTIGIAGLAINPGQFFDGKITNVSVRQIVPSDGYASYWTGEFSTGAGKFDMNNCVFEVMPDVLDKYSCLLNSWEKEFNIFDFAYALQLAEKSTGVTYQSLVGNTIGSAARCNGFIRCSIAATTKAWYSPDYSSAADMLAKGWCVKSHTVKTEATYKKILVMYDKSVSTYHPFVIGDVIEDVGFGNSATVCDMYETNHAAASGCSPCDCSFGHDCEWWWLIVRNVTDPGNDFSTCNNLLGTVATSLRNGVQCKASTESYCSVKTVWESQLENVPCVSGSCIATPAGWYLISTDCATPGKGYCTFRHCPINVTGTKFRGVLVNYLIDAIASTLCPDVVAMSSIFFENNPDITDPHYVPGINYITGAGNRVMDLMVSSQSDIQNPNASNPATIGIVTLKKLLDWMREVFEVYWDIATIGGNTVIQLEHFNFFSAQASGLNLTATSPYIEYIKAKEKYEHQKITIPQREEFQWGSAGGEDFIGRPIVYNSLCAEKDNTENHTPEGLSTDVGFIQFTPVTTGDVDKFVLLATDFIGGTYQLNYEVGLLTGNSFSNAHLSWANLHFNYHRYNRYLPSGTLNDIATSFFSWKPNIKQAVLEFPLCCEEIIPTNYFVTVLSGIVNANGYVDVIEENLYSGAIKLTLKYSV